MFAGVKLAGGTGCTGLPVLGRRVGRGGGTRSDELSARLPGFCPITLPGTG